MRTKRKNTTTRSHSLTPRETKRTKFRRSVGTTHGSKKETQSHSLTLAHSVTRVCKGSTANKLRRRKGRERDSHTHSHTQENRFRRCLE
jgi:hypothetical protein